MMQSQPQGRTDMPSRFNLLILITLSAGVALIQCGSPDSPSSYLGEVGGATYDQTPRAGFEPLISDYNGEFGDDQIDSLILADLEGLDRRTARRTRYLTLTHLANAGASGREMRFHRAGLTKFVNHLSYASRIAKPVPIDEAQTIFRISLDDYRWSNRHWNEVARRYPYRLSRGTQNESRIRQLTGTNVPRVKADWFANEAGQGNLYYFFMGIFRNVRNFEFRTLGIDVDRNIRSNRVARAATAVSGVSAHNRMVERHETRGGGYYWKSYDFEEPNGRRQRNVFEFPLESRNFRVRGFDAAGGEMIFQLPNGLQGYILTDANGNLLREAPVEIVQDRRRAVLGKAEVEVGVACIGCHVRGMKVLVDQMRKHLDTNGDSFNSFVLDRSKRLYPGDAEVRRAYAEDAARFRQAVDALGWSVDDPEPTIILANRYDEAMTRDLVAAELGVSTDDLLARLPRSQFLSRRLGSLQYGGSVKREIFEDNFFFLVRELRLGRVNGRHYAETEDLPQIEETPLLESEESLPEVPPPIDP